MIRTCEVKQANVNQSAEQPRGGGALAGYTVVADLRPGRSCKRLVIASTVCMNSGRVHGGLTAEIDQWHQHRARPLARMIYS